MMTAQAPVGRPRSHLELDAVRLAWRLSVVVAVLMIVQAAVGISMPSLYHELEWVMAAWFGNDLVTLFVAAPLLIWSLLAARRGSPSAELVWYSMLGFAVYNYAYYLFGANLNWFFPIYVVLFVLPVYSLVLALGQLNPMALARRFSPGAPVRPVGIYMLFTGGGLALAWLGQWAAYMTTGSAPAIGAEAFHLVAAMDLAFMVPLFLLGAVMLLRRRPWGYVIAPIVVMKGASYTLVLTTTSTVASLRGIPGSAAQIPIWAAWTLLGTLALWGLFRHLHPHLHPIETNPPA